MQCLIPCMAGNIDTNSSQVEKQKKITWIPRGDGTPNVLCWSHKQTEVISALPPIINLMDLILQRNLQLIAGDWTHQHKGSKRAELGETLNALYQMHFPTKCEHQNKNNQTFRIVVSSTHKPPNTRRVKPRARDQKLGAQGSKNTTKGSHGRRGNRIGKIARESWGYMGIARAADLLWIHTLRHHAYMLSWTRRTLDSISWSRTLISLTSSALHQVNNRQTIKPTECETWNAPYDSHSLSNCLPFRGSGTLYLQSASFGKVDVVSDAYTSVIW